MSGNELMDNAMRLFVIGTEMPLTYHFLIASHHKYPIYSMVSMLQSKSRSIMVLCRTIMRSMTGSFQLSSSINIEFRNSSERGKDIHECNFGAERYIYGSLSRHQPTAASSR
jgi:hypothetical protein